MLFQKRQHRFGRPADGGALSRHHDRPLQQDGMGGDRLHDVGAAEIGFLLLERLELGLAVADQSLRARRPPCPKASRPRPCWAAPSGIRGSAGSTPFFFRSSRVSRDLLQRGLCQIVMVMRRRGRQAVSALVQCTRGPCCVDHLFGNVVGEAGAGHRGEVARRPCPCGPFPAGTDRSAAAAPGRRRPAIRVSRVGVEFLVQADHRPVERVAVDAGMLELSGASAGSTCRAGAARAPWSGRTPCR